MEVIPNVEKTTYVFYVNVIPTVVEPQKLFV